MGDVETKQSVKFRLEGSKHTRDGVEGATLI